MTQSVLYSMFFCILFFLLTLRLGWDLIVQLRHFQPFSSLLPGFGIDSSLLTFLLWPNPLPGNSCCALTALLLASLCLSWGTFLLPLLHLLISALGWVASQSTGEEMDPAGQASTAEFFSFQSSEMILVPRNLLHVVIYCLTFFSVRCWSCSVSSCHLFCGFTYVRINWKISRLLLLLFHLFYSSSTRKRRVNVYSWRSWCYVMNWRGRGRPLVKK